MATADTGAERPVVQFSLSPEDEAKFQRLLATWAPKQQPIPFFEQPPVVQFSLSPEDQAKVQHLVTEDDTPVDGTYSERQMRLLPDALYASWSGPGEGRPFIALSDVGLFYDVNQPPLVPDVLVSLDVHLLDDPGLTRKDRNSYFVWLYGKLPDAVVEVVSNREGEELGRKLRLYAQIGVRYYIVWDPDDLLRQGRLHIFVNGAGVFQPLQGMWLADLRLGLTIWHGEYQGLEDDFLRWCDPQGQLLLTGQERAMKERQMAEQECQRADSAEQRADSAEQRADSAEQRADTAEQRAERLAARLRELGMEPGNGA